MKHISTFSSRLKKVSFVFLIIFVSLAVFYAVKNSFAPYVFDDKYVPFKDSDKVLTRIIAGKSQYRLLIFGDSTAKTAFSPALIGQDVWNVAVGNGVPVYDYLILKKLAKFEKLPAKIVLMYHPMAFFSEVGLWKSYVAFGFEEMAPFVEIALTNYQDGFFDYIRSVYGFLKKYMSSKLQILPQLRVAASIGFSKQKEKKEKMQKELFESRGHVFFGQATKFSEVSVETQREKPLVTKLQSFYLRRLLELADKNDIQVLFMISPFNTRSCRNFSTTYRSALKEFLRSLQKGLRSVEVVKELICLPAVSFGDSTHVNRAGMKVMSKMVRDKLNLID